MFIALPMTAIETAVRSTLAAGCGWRGSAAVHLAFMDQHGATTSEACGWIADAGPILK
jgi:hypothetical protein